MTIGEAILSPALQPLFDKLYFMGEELLSKLTGSEVANTVQQWKEQLEMIQAVLVDAEQKQFSSTAVKIWLRKLQDVAYDMEDVLDHFANQVHENQLKNQEDCGIFASATNMVENLSENLSNLFSSMDQGIQEKIEDINKRLEVIQKQATNLQLLAGGVKETEVLRSQRETSSLVSDSKIFGRNDMKQEIITRLLKDDDDQSDENYVMIPLVGTGGIGKTTLAQYVYNDEQLKDHFDLMAWVCVSDVFDVKRIIKKICKAAPSMGTVVDFSTLDEAQTQLKEALMSRKFLIVLDDVWSENYDDWIQLRTPFMHAVKGSRVIMTTRIENIANLMNTNSKHDNIIYIKGLSDDDCWHLVQQHANNKNDLAEMRADIINKCKGLPLAAKALGGLLKMTTDTRQCQQILKNELWSEDKSSVLPVLRLSYHYLPAHLKRVFAYCSIFPKDTEFKKKEVVLLWMAQGFLPENQSQSNGSMEDTGHCYFAELASRSLIEQSGCCDLEKFIMHDLIHDMALLAAGDICHVMDTKDITKVGQRRARHVFLTKEAASALGSPFPMASQLRTFHCNLYGVRSIENLDFIQRFSCIRALHLASNRIEVLPDCIGDFKHLRFLSLKTNSIKELPKSISCLWNLQTLWLADCSKLEKVPNIGFLKKLHHLYIDTESLQEMPWGIGNLTNLQSLNKFVLGDGHGSRVRELKNLNNLQGALRIYGLRKVTNAEDAKEAQLHKKCGLDELSLNWGRNREFWDGNTQGVVLEQLKPPTSIKVCTLVGYGGSNLPAWLGDPSFTNLESLHIKGCLSLEADLPPHLPHLRRLYIGDCKQIRISLPSLPSLVQLVVRLCIKLIITTEDSCELAHLTKLKIVYCPNLVSLLLEGLLLPALEDIEISDCESLESLPSQMHKFTSLHHLKIDKCPKLQCIPSFEEHVSLPSSLSEIFISGNPNLKNLSVVDSTNLTALCVANCPNLEPLVGNFTSLSYLKLWNCPKLHSLPQGILNSLKYLTIFNLGSCTDAIERIPGPDIDLPSSLLLLSIKGFQNLKSVSFYTLPNLATLCIECCPKFESFGDNALPPQLKDVRIEECDMIKSQLKSDPNGLISMDGERFSLP